MSVTLQLSELLSFSGLAGALTRRIYFLGLGREMTGAVELVYHRFNVALKLFLTECQQRAPMFGRRLLQATSSVNYITQYHDLPSRVLCTFEGLVRLPAGCRSTVLSYKWYGQLKWTPEAIFWPAII